MVMARTKEGLEPIEISCFYEELPVLGIGHIVPQHSAILPGFNVPVGIHANHMNMCKFSDARDPGFLAVCGELREWIVKVKMEATQDWNLRPVAVVGNNSQNAFGAPFLVPYTRNPNFVGRAETIEKIEYQLAQGRGVANETSQRRASLHGLGGIGKTQIALEYVYRIRAVRPYLSVYWVHASSSQRFYQSYFTIAQEWQIPIPNESNAALLSSVKYCLESANDRCPWLMVVDNADDLELFSSQLTQRREATVNPNTAGSSTEGDVNLAQYLPETPHGAILITTRNKQVGVRLTKGKLPLEVSAMDPDEATNLLYKLLDTSLTANEAASLAARLDYLPLAMSQAAAFTLENSISVSDYLQLIDRSDQDFINLLSEEFETVGKDSGTPQALAQTWIISFEQIQGLNPLAAEFLSLMAFFDRVGIPYEFLSIYSKHRPNEEQKGELELIKAVGVLKAFSFVTESAKYKDLNMHRLVHLVTRKWLSAKGTTYHFQRQALFTVARAFPCTFEDYEKCNLYLPHAISLQKLKFVGTMDEEIAIGVLRYRKGNFVNEEVIRRGLDAQALKWAISDAQARRAELGDDHPETLEELTYLALRYEHEGLTSEAVKTMEQVLNTSKEVLGSEHHDTLARMDYLVRIYSTARQWKEAEQLAVHVVETRSRLFGEEHRDTMISKDKLAGIYLEQKQLGLAESLSLDVLRFRERVLGLEHPSTVHTLLCLAQIRMLQGLFADAFDLVNSSIQRWKRVGNQDDPVCKEAIATRETLRRVLQNKEVIDKKVNELGKKLRRLKKMLWRRKVRWKRWRRKTRTRPRRKRN
ncbi:hypothetical protein VTI74DRAFT_5958 [Chaetomium olivicolor]